MYNKKYTYIDMLTWKTYIWMHTYTSTRNTKNKNKLGLNHVFHQTSCDFSVISRCFHVSTVIYTEAVITHVTLRAFFLLEIRPKRTLWFFLNWQVSLFVNQFVKVLTQCPLSVLMVIHFSHFAASFAGFRHFRLGFVFESIHLIYSHRFRVTERTLQDRKSVV